MATRAVIVTADTNIYISALYFGGKPLDFLRRAMDRDFRLVLSPPILDEILRVLRDKFGASETHLRATQDLLMDCTDLCEPVSALQVILEDPADDRVLECAADSGSALIVGGDGDLLRLRSFRNIRIVTVGEFFQLYP